MKKFQILLTWITILLTLGLLSACAGSTISTADSTKQSMVESKTSGEVGENNMPLAMDLALGTFKLEETDYPLTTEQAQTLLPLWKAARSLSESETTAVQEIEAVVDQIQGTMTTEQLQAIEAMELTMQDMANIGEDFGLGFGSLDPEMQTTMQPARASGQGPPDDLGAGQLAGMGDGVSLSPEQHQTAIAARSGSSSATLGLNAALLDAIIDFLQAKIA